jgi:Ca2+/Na+ antiporter
MTAPDPVRAGRALGGAAAAILVLEGIATLFVPRGIAQDGVGLTGGRLTYLLVLALVLILAAGIQRRERGVLIGTVLQVPLLLTGLLNNVMWFVAGAFVLIWLYLLQVRKELLGAPFGAPRAPVTDDGDGGAAPTP